jgi:CRISPR-associated protein Csm3
MTTTHATPGIIFHNLEGQLEVITGLLIGGSESGLEVGGVDKTFIHTREGYPYIPGSSLKGKIRSILERHQNKLSPNGAAHSCEDAQCDICQLFGAGNVRDHLPERGPTRLLFRDAAFSDISRREFIEAMDKGERYYETKTETAINRRTGAAFGGSLHTFERVPPGAVFDFRITLRALQGDDVAAMQRVVEAGLRGLENDYLGSSGSRGYGRVKVTVSAWQQAEL